MKQDATIRNKQRRTMSFRLFVYLNRRFIRVPFLPLLPLIHPPASAHTRWSSVCTQMRARTHGHIRYSPQAAGYCNHADVSWALQAERARTAAGVQGLTRNQGVSRTRQFICSRSIIPPKSDEQPLVYSLEQVTASG